MATRFESVGLRSPDNVDRIMLVACALIWLAVIGVGVAATVVLIDKGSSGQDGVGSDADTPWLLYAVMGLSAVIIVGAVPLLLRARREAEPERRRSLTGEVAAPLRVREPAEVTPTEAPTEKLRVFGSIADPADRRNVGSQSRHPESYSRTETFAETADRVWLRATALIAGAMGAAMLAVGFGTYLMGVDNDGLAWVAYCLAAIITAAMPVIPWLYLRRLRAEVNAALLAQP